MKPPPAISPDRRDELASLIASGMSYKAAAVAMGVSYGAVSYSCRRWKIESAHPSKKSFRRRREQFIEVEPRAPDKSKTDWREIALRQRVSGGMPLDVAARISHLSIEAARVVMARKA